MEVTGSFIIPRFRTGHTGGLGNSQTQQIAKSTIYDRALKQGNIPFEAKRRALRIVATEEIDKNVELLRIGLRRVLYEAVNTA